MRILHIDVNYGKSSTGKIVATIHEKLLEQGHDSLACYGRGEKSEVIKTIKFSNNLETYFHALMARVTGLNGFFSFFSTSRLIRIIKKFNPDIIHIHELHAYFVNHGQLMRFISKRKIELVWTFHCEYMYTGKCGHSHDCNKWKTQCKKCPLVHDYPKSLLLDFTKFMHEHKKKHFSLFDHMNIVTPSKWLSSRVQESFLKQFRLSVVYNGIDTNVFKYTDNSDLKSQYKIENKKIVLSIAPNILSTAKGGKWIEELSEKFEDDSVIFILIGVDGRLPQNKKNLIYLNRIYDKTLLAQFYSMADVFLITSMKENFPTTCLESLSCGTQVLGFKGGGTEETAQYPYGEFVKYGQLDILSELIKQRINNPISKNECREYALSRYSNESMYDNYMTIYKEAMKVKNEGYE